MIYARSPYIVHVDDAGLEDIEFKLYIYTGTKDVDKGTADYEFAIDAINGEVTFDISPYIRDFLTSIVPNNKSAFVWVTTEIDKDTGSGLSGTFSTYEATQLACYGYTETDQGVNYSSEINNAEIMSDANVYPDTTTIAGIPATTICKSELKGIQIPVRGQEFLTLGGHEYTVTYYEGITPSSGTNTSTVISGPTTITSADLDESNDNIVYLDAPTLTKGIILRRNVTTQYINIYNVGDCRDQITRIFFLNKLGVTEELHFVGRRTESYTTTSDSFKRNILASGTYSKWKHQNRSFNRGAKERITINSGFYPESYNEQFKQLLLSEFVWMLPEDLAIGSNNFVPINIVDSEISYKSSRYDKMINYEMTFEMSQSHINDIK